MVIMVIVVIICCRGPAHCQVLRTAADFSLDGVIAPRAVGGRLKPGKKQRQIRSVSLGSREVSLPRVLTTEFWLQDHQQANPTSHCEQRAAGLPSVPLGYCLKA